MSAGFVILAATISAFVPGSALAQIVKAALVKNVDERGRVPFTFASSCQFTTGNTCTLNIPSVLVGSRLVLEHFNTSLKINRNSILGPVELIGIHIFTGGSSSDFAPVLVYEEINFRNWIVNQPVLAYVEAGTSAFVQVDLLGSSVGGSSGSVKVTGYLVDLTI